MVLPDIRGVGQSVWADPARHGWSRYVDDLPLLLNEIGVDRAVVAGAGMGSTIALLAGLRLPDPLHAIGAAGVEAIEIDENSEARKAVATVLSPDGDPDRAPSPTISEQPTTMRATAPAILEFIEHAVSTWMPSIYYRTPQVDSMR